MTLIYEKNSDGVVFKKLPEGSYLAANVNGGEYLAWALVNEDVPLNTDLDSIII
jgi:hypothetical protein